MEYDEPRTASSRGLTTAGLAWQNGIPTLRMEDAVVETVVTHTTRTTTSFAPIVLPRIPSPETLGLPTHLKHDQYPLAGQPAPPEMQFFTLNLGGRRVVVQDESAMTSSTDGSLRSSGPGWTKTLITSTYDSPAANKLSQIPDEKMGFLQALNKSKGKEVRKRPHSFSRPGSRQEEGLKVETHVPPISATEQLIVRQRSPPRKKIRGMEELSIHPQTGNSSLLSPLPSPEQEAGPSTPISTTSPSTPNLGSGAEVAALLSLPSLVSQFDQLPDRLQQHFLMHLLRRSRMPTIQRVSTFASIALKRDFIALLPHEVAVQILRKVDRASLAVSSRVCRKWRRMIDTERVVWRQRLIDDDLWYGQGVEEAEERKILDRYETLDWKAERDAQTFGLREDTPSDDERMLSATNPSRLSHEQERSTPLKHVYRRRYQNQKSWLHTRPEHTSFSGHGTNVVTCLQFDDDKIISASDDHSINVYETMGGHLRQRLDGHEGGVWTLEYKGDTMVSGSTDRTVRIWDLDEMKQVHVFNGHTSTVRCLQIVEPVWNEKDKEFQPPYPMIVTGSRDATLRVWRLPEKDDQPYIGASPSGNHEDENAPPPDENPYHLHLLEGHTQAVRALATHGKICVSGSYDMTVRVWDIVKGTCIHVLTGHEAKVYSIVYDQYRNRCASGSMDNTVKVWDVTTGECLHTLTGHTSLVGLLGISPNYLVSAAADASLRVWNPETLEVRHVLASHGGAITCFQHDETKVVSGSDGALKLWDIKTGTYIRDLVVGISSVWQVAFNGNLLVAASNRGGQTVFDVFNFAPTTSNSPFPEGIDDDNLDLLRTPEWQKHLRIGNNRNRRKTVKRIADDYHNQGEVIEVDSEDDEMRIISPTISRSHRGHRSNISNTPSERWAEGMNLPSNAFNSGSGSSPSRKAHFGGSGTGSRRSNRIAGRNSLPSNFDPLPIPSINIDPSSSSNTSTQRNQPPAFSSTHISFTASPTHQRFQTQEQQNPFNTSRSSSSKAEGSRTRLRKLRSNREREDGSPTPRSSRGLIGMGIGGIGHIHSGQSSSSRNNRMIASTANAIVGSGSRSSFAPIFDDEGVLERNAEEGEDEEGKELEHDELDEEEDEQLHSGQVDSEGEGEDGWEQPML
ncbi:uncharacterized protein L201_007241 [Kwoniella dendrophila CBS 6074]|uniref:F-box domain-containing protein n=1 Tax=Kwoniella dendrophila CBS 6074 TaxID=1295534 RepID=A0AAX4K3Z8_9TREE